MTKVKVTLSCEKMLIDLAKKQNINLSQLLDYSLAINLRVKKVTTWIQEIEQY